MKHVFRPAALAFCSLVLVSMAVPSLVLAGDLPDQLTRLLPEDAEIVLVVPSVDEVERIWAEVQALAAEFDPDEADEMPPFSEILSAIPAPYNESLDRGRPLAMAAHLPDLMAGQEVSYSFVVPVLPGDTDWQGLGAMLQMPTVLHQDGYLLLSLLPEFTPGQGPVSLMKHLPAGAVQAALDMKKIWAKYGPMVEFGLGMAAQPQQGPDGQPADPAMTQEETQALARMVSDFFSSTEALALGIDLMDGQAHLNESLVVQAGSALAPGPQPDFNAALELTRLLPRDADWSMAYAVDLKGLVEIYKDFYTISLTRNLGMAGGDPDFPMATFLEAYFQALDLTMAPTAMTVDMDHDRMAARSIIRTDRAQEYLALQEQILGQMGETFQFLVPERRDGLKVEGMDVIAWDFTWDSAALAQMAGAAEMPDEDAAEVLTAMTELYQQLLPGTRTVVKDDLIFLCMDRDENALADMIKQSKQRRGAPNPDLVRLAKRAGPRCQAVFQGDMAPLMNMIFEIAEEFGDEDLPALELDPIPASYVLSVGDNTYTVSYQVGLRGLGKFIQAMDELEEPAQADQGQ
jgi:hypothetical protein